MIAVNPTKIKVSREKKGLSQEYMASVLDVSQPTYARMENGKQRIEGAQLYKIAQELEEKIESFIDEAKTVYQQGDHEFKDNSVNQNIYFSDEKHFKKIFNLLSEEISEMRKERKELIALLKEKR
ncbi:MAG: helix-turn-helix transcriptional regulator [Cryomorphaceae bacterium]|nr:helix-turn-helix transcriptional regulator [Cryomorphaceae bacterium]